MIIGLMGMSRVGKDEFSKAFLESGFVRYAFGDAVKNEYADLSGLLREDMFNENKEKNRAGIINHGETKRLINPFHWIDVIKPDVIKTHMEGGNVIITDIRRIPELIFINSLKGAFGNDEVKLVEIKRPLANGGIFDSDAETSHAIVYAHYHSLVDRTIENKYSEDYLYEKATKMYQWYLYEKEKV